MQDLVFVSSNTGKINEISNLLKDRFHLKGLNDLGFYDSIDETGLTLKDNAFIKAQTIHNQFNVNCFADDSGLMIEALDFQPGVKSARFAGQNATDLQNIQKVIELMKGKENRSASFNTVICLIFEGNTYYFEGKIEGEITNTTIGNNGFGYDPIFIPKGYNITFAQMAIDEKNKISHRKIAVNKLISHLLKNV